MFSALHHNSVNFVLCWMLVGGQLIDVGAALLLQGQKPGNEAKLLLSVGVGAAGTKP